VSSQAGSIAGLARSVRAAPASAPALLALVLFVVWAGSQAGYPVTHWAPGGLIVLALLLITLWSVPLRLPEIPVSVRVALASLGLYTLLSFLSILWAGVASDAWEGANRTLLYLLVFALFALWPQRGTSAVLLVGAWTVAMIALAAFVILHIDAASNLAGLFAEGRLGYPAGYENASAATWAMPMWPALLLATSRRLPWGIRGLLAGGTVLLGDLALLSQSRGSLYATVIMLVLVFALLPGRLRTFVLLVPVVIGIALTTPVVLRVGDRLLHGGDAKAALHSATGATFAAAVLVGLVVSLGAALETRRSLSPASRERLRRGVGVAALATLAALLAGGWVAAGDPVARARHGWQTFKGGYGANSRTGSRLISGLGSGRYDFYRVALDEFAGHPALGIGVDNFQQQYLKHGRSDETPRYPHSVELRTLAETGLAGLLLGLVGLGGALVAGGRALRRSDPLGRTAAAAALAGFGYWMVHGSFDWFWEFAGLGAPAFALLGLACALSPRRPADSSPAASEGRHSARRWPAIAAGALVGLAIAASLLAPWLSQLQIQSAARIWTRAPRRAYARLDEAARLNPLSDEANLVAGSIALRFGDLARADHEFSLALRRTPADAYATLERGAIASARGDRARALTLLQRAARLSPRDGPTARALLEVREGRRVSIEALNRLILEKARQLM
jgi:hypothetical protein